MYPMTLIRSDSPQVSGFWARDMTTGELRYVDTCPEHGGIVSTVLPRVDSHHRYIRERASDLTLNSTVENLHYIWRTLRGTGKELFSPDPAAFWDRVFGSWKVSGGSPKFTVFAGVDHGDDFTTPSRGGLVIDASQDGTSVTGFRINAGMEDVPATTGPGRGRLAASTNGGHGTVGGPDVNDGIELPAIWALAALETGTFNRLNLAMGGTGGRANAHAGDGYVRVQDSDLTESDTRDLSGSSANANSGGSGGGLYLVGRRSATFSGSVDLRNGNDHATEGNGRITFFTVKPPVNTGTHQGAVLTWIQLSPSTLAAGPQSY